MDEKVFFENDVVQVTNARFKVDGQTYAIRNITSTAAWTKPQKVVLPALAFFMALGMFVQGKDGIGGGIFFLLVAAVSFWLGREVHFVKLNTASGEVKALKSDQKDYVVKVVTALNDAIVSQHKSAE